MKTVRARLTDDEVREIHDLLSRHVRHSYIARLFCVHQSTITRIALGDSHADVLDAAERIGPCRCHKCLIEERRVLNIDLAHDGEAPQFCVHCGRDATARRSEVRLTRGLTTCTGCDRRKK